MREENISDDKCFNIRMPLAEQRIIVNIITTVYNKYQYFVTYIIKGTTYNAFNITNF